MANPRAARRRRIGTAGAAAVRFTRSGTFNYRCTIHVREGMRGKIVVH